MMSMRDSQRESTFEGYARRMGDIVSHRSFANDGTETVTMQDGRIGHRDLVAHLEVLQPQFYVVRDGVWCFVGNGLSNQTFIEVPEGIIAIDTGESNEEMNAALVALREHTQKPIVAVLYTHFHYVAGTRAVFADAGRDDVPIYAHARVDGNRTRAQAEVGPTYARGIIEQFALFLPPDGPDANIHVGLGRHYRNPSHAPFTPGYVTPTHTFDGPTTLRIGGADVEVTPAPSDADDSVTYWFPSLGVAVNNLVWPVLFNVFAIRGEEYRDPRVLLRGLDHLLSLAPEFLVGTHGPPLTGSDQIRRRVTRYRDAIQFLWDQTVRGANKGLTSNELAHSITLPDLYRDDYLTRELYGVVEHHVRQIRTGLFGWFDGDPAQLFPLPTSERADRIIAGFGGADVVARQAEEAIANDDLRWAVELCSWLVEHEGSTATDRNRLARALRLIAQRTSAANIRSWCLTRALSLEGALDLSRLYGHRLHPLALAFMSPEFTVQLLRVMVDPARAEGVDTHVAWHFESSVAGLHLRHGVAAVTTGEHSDVTMHLVHADWARIMGGDISLDEAIDSGVVRVEGDTSRLRRAMDVFDLPSLRTPSPSPSERI